MGGPRACVGHPSQTAGACGAAACNGPVFSEIRHDQLHASEHRQQPSMPEKVALIGSGNWGSAIATKIGKNVLENDMFDKGAAPYS
jgi:hypothetical protein